MKIFKFLIPLLLSCQVCFGAASRTFDGVDDRINVGSGTTLDSTTTYSSCTWLYYTGPNAAGNHYVMSKNGTNRVYIGVQDDGTHSNKFYGFVGRATTNAQYISPANDVPDSSWVNFCVTYDDARGNNARFDLYKNGVESSPTVLSEGSGTITDDSGGNANLGSRTTDDARVMGGDMAYVTLYKDRITSVTEINELMWKPESVPLSLSGLWPLWGDSTEIDLSGNGNTGSLTGTTTSTNGPPVMFGGGMPL